MTALDLSSWNKIIDDIANKMHKGKLQPKDLHKGLINKTYKELNTAASEGYGVNYSNGSANHINTVSALQGHLYRFSGAKTYQQLVEMNDLLVNEEGKIRSFSEYKAELNKVHEKYNRNYLQAEYQTAKRSAQAVRQWNGYQDDKDLFPNLQYMTVDDGKVRDEHKPLHKIIKPVDDPFWNTYFPPNGWRCRCYTKQTSEAATKGEHNATVEEAFKNNVGKTNDVFNEKKHPYFQIPKSDRKDVETAINNNLAIESGSRALTHFKNKVSGQEMKVPEINASITPTNRDVKNLIRKPHQDRVGRNNLVYNLKKHLKEAKLVLKAKEGKNRDEHDEWYYLEAKGVEGKFYFNIVKTKDGRYRLHSITDKIKK